jgi:hypothetical protein
MIAARVGAANVTTIAAANANSIVARRIVPSRKVFSKSVAPLGRRIETTFRRIVTLLSV